MLIELTHTTELTYSEPIHESVMELRVCPAQASDQVRLSFDLAIGPAAQVQGYFDWLDNHVHAFSIHGYHDRIRIAATSLVQTDKPSRSLDDLEQLPGTYPLDDAVDADYTLFDFLDLKKPIADSGALRAIAADVNAQPGEPLGVVVRRAMGLVKSRFEYVQGVTTSATPVAEFLEHGRGVCQDFTHAFIGILRCLNIPARYVSGIVHADEESEATRYRGSRETHAWVEVYFPNNSGGGEWIGVDPTNGCCAGPDFIKVAVGRSFSDVPPNRGVYRGSGKESIDVSVTTRRLPSVPPELTAERFRKLNVPVRDAPTPILVGGGQQQQQQQQQQ